MAYHDDSSLVLRVQQKSNRKEGKIILSATVARIRSKTKTVLNSHIDTEKITLKVNFKSLQQFLSNFIQAFELKCST